MELSKSNHYQMEYSLKKLSAYVNSKTGRVSIIFPEFSQNAGNLKLSVNFILSFVLIAIKGVAIF